MRLGGFLLAVSLLLLACFDPTIRQGVPCGPEDQCPSGQVCASDGRCYPPDDLPQIDAAVPPDADRPDATVPSDADLTPDADLSPDAEPNPACSNSEDDDGDGDTDFPNDPGCETPEDDDEADLCPDDSSCPECANEQDDDSDGDTDFPDDVDCESASDDHELTPCTDEVEVILLTKEGATGTTPALPISNFQGSCHADSTSSEVVYAFYLDQSLASLTFSTLGSAGDTVTYVRYADCAGGTEVGCAQVQGGGEEVEITSASDGWYYVFVDGDFVTGIDYVLEVRGVIGSGQPCDPDDDVFVCEPVTFCDSSGGSPVCVRTACSNGEDDDSDGQADYPNDPGCTDGEDDDEGDDDCQDCPGNGGAGCGACPTCGDGDDNDVDGETDFPTDPGCVAASDDSEVDACVTGVEPGWLTDAGVVGTTPTSGTGFYEGSCVGPTGIPEDVYAYYNTRELSMLGFSTLASTGDTALYLKQDDCDSSTELDCAEWVGGEFVRVYSPTVNTMYYVFVDGYTGPGLDYVLEVRGTVGQGQSCTPGDTQFPCVPGHYCADSLTCEITECFGGGDEDGDGLSNYPDDPGCESINDNSEGSDDCQDCPGNGGAGCVACPACGDGEDNDFDTFTDFPQDIGCDAASDDDETDECIPGVPVNLLTDAGATGTTPSGTTPSEFNGTCEPLSDQAPEDVYGYRTTRALDYLRFTVTAADDTVTYLRHPDCGNSSDTIDCWNDAGGGEWVATWYPEIDAVYYLFVDGAGTAAIDYTITVSGTVSPGAPCTAGDPSFPCRNGYACRSGTCMLAYCNDGIDNDNPPDGLTDYPTDPGCASRSDDSEADDCDLCVGNGGPGCNSCPECSDGDDNDGDDLDDWGLDPGCSFAGDPEEIDECVPGVHFDILSDSGAGGTTPMLSEGSYAWGTCFYPTQLEPEDIYAYTNMRDLSTLSFTVDTGVGDPEAVAYVRYGMCNEISKQVACALETDGVATATVYSPVFGGIYYVFVDGGGFSEIPYVLYVSGEVLPGAACVQGSMQFPCEFGYKCDETTSDCVVTACNNDIDDEPDGFIDLFDPGCVDANDDDESDDTCAAAPGTCPQCADGEDNDGDGAIDYDADTGCANGADDVELNCADSDPIVIFATSPETGTTTGATDDFTPTCVGSSTAPDVVYQLRIPGQLDTLVIDTNGSTYDTVLHLMRRTCEEDAIRCDDDGGDGTRSQISMTNVAADDYFIIVDGFSTSSGSYTLNVNGEISLGEPCDPIQVQAGFFTCAGAASCNDFGTGYICN